MGGADNWLTQHGWEKRTGGGTINPNYLIYGKGGGRVGERWSHPQLRGGGKGTDGKDKTARKFYNICNKAKGEESGGNASLKKTPVCTTRRTGKKTCVVPTRKKGEKGRS